MNVGHWEKVLVTLENYLNYNCCKKECPKILMDVINFISFKLHWYKLDLSRTLYQAIHPTMLCPYSPLSIHFPVKRCYLQVLFKTFFFFFNLSENKVLNTLGTAVQSTYSEAWGLVWNPDQTTYHLCERGHSLNLSGLQFLPQ